MNNQMNIVSKKPITHQNLKLPFLSLPGYLYWKDLNGNYLGCNDPVADSLNLASVKDIEGKTDLCFSWRNDYQIIRNHDNQVQGSNRPFCFVEPIPLPDNSVLNLVSVKVPLFSSDNQIAGVFGISYDFDGKSVNETLLDLLLISEAVQLRLDFGLLTKLLTQCKQINILQKIWQKNRPLFDYGQVCYTFREAQCLHYFLNHHSAQKTAEKIYLSSKTVEYHLAKVKEKLGISDVSIISQLAIEYGFIDLMFMKF